MAAPDLRLVAPPDAPRPDLAAVLRRLLGPGVAVAGGAIIDWQAPLLPPEEEAVARAVPRRRAEFAAGRASARAALAALGLPASPLPRRPDGPPLWPPGVTGSLSHGGGHVLAAVGRLGPGLAALGLDIEPLVPLAPDLAADLARTICGPGEDRARAVEVFGAKEAAFKAQFALTGRLLGFGAMRVALGPDGRFRATLTEGAGPWAAGSAIEGAQAVARGLLLSAVRLP